MMMMTKSETTFAFDLLCCPDPYSISKILQTFNQVNKSRYIRLTMAWITNTNYCSNDPQERLDSAHKVSWGELSNYASFESFASNLRVVRTIIVPQILAAKSAESA